MRRRGSFALLAFIWKTPWLLALVVVLTIVGVGAWLWNEMQESKASEKMKHAERNRHDSIWKD